MKEQLFKSLILLSIIFIAYSCGQNEVIDIQGVDGQGGNDNQSLFTIHAGEIQGFSGDRYIMATSPTTGEVLFWDVMTSFEDNITFDAKGSETVDLTYASEYNTGFGIITYRDVKSEFKFSRFLYPCYDGQFSYDSLSYKSVDIIFQGTKEIVDIINPAYDHNELQQLSNATIDEKNKIIYDLDNDITIVNARLSRSSMDLQFVFRFLGEQDYKSIVVKREDWVKVDDDNYKLELEVEDLRPCNVHEIEVDKDGTWILDSEILTSNGDRILIAQWSNYSQNQSGERIKLYVQNDLEIEQLLLKIRRNTSFEGFQFQKYFDEIPDFIPLKDFGSEVSDLTTNTYNYSSTENYDIIKTSYEYRIDNAVNHWHIYQSLNSTSDYRLPTIESGFLDETNFIKPILMNPSKFYLQFYSLEAPVDQVYYETGIDRQLPCLSFNSSYNSFGF